MPVELHEGETFTAELIFHVDHNILNKIIKEEIAKAMVNINEQIEQYLVDHIRASAIGGRI